jgi:hypothetical protein
MTQHLDSLQHAWSLSNRDWSKGSPRGGTQNLDQWGVVGQERMLSGNSSYSWSNTSDLSGMRELTGLSSSPLLNGNLENLESYAGGIDARNLSTTFPAIFSDKCKIFRISFLVHKFFCECLCASSWCLHFSITEHVCGFVLQ